jgi:hypothetical protein
MTKGNAEIFEDMAAATEITRKIDLSFCGSLQQSKLLKP